MHFLECIAMLRYIDEKLQANKRNQVSVQIVHEAMSILVQVRSKLEGNLPPGGIYLVTENDLLNALTTISKTPGLTFLTETMKDAVSSGIKSLIGELCTYAYKYFTVHQIPSDICATFDSDDSTLSSKNILRLVAQTAIDKGLYRQ